MPDQKLLIVEDSPDIHELVKLWLAGEPVELHCCYSGEEALASMPHVRPDLVLLDVDLPGLDGFEVCQRLKGSAATADVPVVFLTGASSTEQKLRGLELGAIDYITKPFDPAELRARVRSSLNTRRLMDLLEQKALVLQESEERYRVLAHREQLRAEVLEMIAQGSPLNDVLRRLTQAAERHEPQAIAAGVMLNAGRLYHCAPNLPPSIATSIERQLYAFVARFSDLAAQSGDRTIVCDLRTDPAWEEMRAAIREHGICYCWATLIRARQREAAGVFALYRRDERCPSAASVELLKLASEMIEVAVERQQLNDQLAFQARHDALTQLPNRALFSDRLEQALANAARTGQPAAVLLIDLDRFKFINDTYGHQAGDEMLCQVAHRLKRRLRANDVLARMGGDEFAVIIADLSGPDDAQVVARSLNDELKVPVELQGRKQFVTLSIGSAVYPRDAADPSTLLRNADLALYRAKDSGRNTVRAFTHDMGEGTAERMEIESELREAAANGELFLNYQPKVAPDGRVVGVESLLRWRHPRLGLVPPAKFIPMAEDSGMIIPIGGWVLEESARRCRDWYAAGLGVVPVAVNVSALQFAQPDFVGTVANALRIAGTPKPWLEIELTESLLMRNIRDAGDKLAQLRQMKVTIAVDDFGTGYSSLAYLQRLSLDTLKIDHSFVSAIADPGTSRPGATRDCQSARIIVKAIVALAKSLGLRVIAEGVETAGQRDFLVKLGCDYLQGYLFGPPTSADQVEAMIRRETIHVAEPLARSA